MTTSKEWRTTLLNEQIEQSSTRRRAKPVKVPMGQERAYRAELLKIVKMVKQDVDEQILPLVVRLEPQYTADSWVDMLSDVLERVIAKWKSPQFELFVQQTASKFVTTTATLTRGQFERSMKSVGLNIYGDSPTIQSYIESSVYDNVSLIKSIPDQYLNNVRNIVNTNVRAGFRSSAIAEQLRDQFDVTERRARFIARDQTAKLNGQLAQKRQIGSGFEYFEWDDSDDERVRERHSAIAKRVTAYGVGIYRWDNPPLSDNGTPIIPGQDFNCRCTARPVDQREVDANVKAGRTNPSVKR